MCLDELWRNSGSGAELGARHSQNMSMKPLDLSAVLSRPGQLDTGCRQYGSDDLDRAGFVKDLAIGVGE